jgi:ABC-type transporter Mla maintaining outer membrane lipid asymmetry ATPase subunit MlaF
MSDLIELRDITLLLGGHESLRNVSLQFPEGTCTVILGPSGCGKSTLLKVASGIIPPDRGSVLYRGEDIFGMSERRLLEFRKINGFSFQDSALWENKTIFDNLALPLQVHSPEMTRAEIERRVIRMLERGNLVDSIHYRPAQCSVGERKIVSILRALIGEPSLVFMDTPTGTIDPGMAEMVLSMIRDCKARGCTIVMVSHDKRIASTLADRLVVVIGGTLAAAGEFNEVKKSADPRVREVIAEVLGEIASFDTDLLSLLGEGNN